MLSGSPARNRMPSLRFRWAYPAEGGDIGYGVDSVWLSVFDVPLTRVDAATNRVVKQGIGKGGDSLRFGFDSL